MGISAGFSRNTPHDGYFFDHPDEIIAGAIPPPKFNLKNLEAISRHIRSLVLELAEIDFPRNLETLLTEKGGPIESQIAALLTKVKGAGAGAAATALKLWSDVDGVTEEFAKKVVERFPEQIRPALVQRGELLAHAAAEVRKLGDKIKLSLKEEQAQKGFRQLAIRLREDNKYAYLPRCWPRRDCCPATRFRAIRDRCRWATIRSRFSAVDCRLSVSSHGAIIYARGGRWSVTGVALHRPGSSDSSGQRTFDFTLCGGCGLANAPALDFCSRCQHPIGDSTGSGLNTFTAWDAGGFKPGTRKSPPRVKKNEPCSRMTAVLIRSETSPAIAIVLACGNWSCARARRHLVHQSWAEGCSQDG